MSQGRRSPLLSAKRSFQELRERTKNTASKIIDAMKSRKESDNNQTLSPNSPSEPGGMAIKSDSSASTTELGGHILSRKTLNDTMAEMENRDDNSPGDQSQSSAVARLPTENVSSLVFNDHIVHLTIRLKDYHF